MVVPRDTNSFHHYRRKRSTWLSHLISIDALSLLAAISVFSSGNSAFSFQDHNRISKIRHQWSDFVKIPNLNSHDRATRTMSSGGVHSVLVTKGVEQISNSLTSCLYFSEQHLYKFWQAFYGLL
jgi:hypothetical protein